MLPEERRARLIHWMSVGTALVSLVPILLGSLVTTLGAGMAFLDWPTSDGQGMLTYPWLQSHGDEFVEHGHRLAGMLIGLCSIGLCVAAHVLQATSAVRAGSIAVLAGVIVQGLLGGLRVRLDATTVALGHSLFGCLVFVALWIVATISKPPRKTSAETSDVFETSEVCSKHFAMAVPVVFYLQYLVGAFLRHLGMLMDLHLAGAVLVPVLAIVVVLRSRAASVTIKRRSQRVLAAVLLQVSLGVGVWLTKYGLSIIGLVAVQHSNLQIVLRSLHTLGGMLVVATAVSWTSGVFAKSLAKDASSWSTSPEPA